MSERATPWTFAELEPGALLGAASLCVDDAYVSRWRDIYPWSPDTSPHVPAGMAMLVVMRSYAEAVSPRPPGNVHAGQALTIERLPRIGQPVTTTVRCASVELRNERRWVRLAFDTVDQGHAVCYWGEITTLWAR